MSNLDYLILFALSLLILYFFLKNRYLIGKYFHVLDIPSKDKIHISTTPLVGSFSLILISIIFIFFFNNSYMIEKVIMIFTFSYLFFIMGYIDDRYNIKAYTKLLFSIIFLTLALNLSDNFLLKDIYVGFLDRHFFLDKISFFFSILCLLLLINALNLIDGINGLASGFASIWLFCLSLLSSGEIKTFFLLFSFFAIVNTYYIIKGKYFLGDSGTLFLGSLVGLLTIYTYNNLFIVNLLIPIEKIFIFFMIPGIDMFRLFIIRLSNKKDPFSRDLNHQHHIMLKYFSLYKTLSIYFILFITTNTLSFFDYAEPIVIILIYLVLYVLFIFFFIK